MIIRLFKIYSRVVVSFLTCGPKNGLASIIKMQSNFSTVGKIWLVPCVPSVNDNTKVDRFTAGT